MDKYFLDIEQALWGSMQSSLLFFYLDLPKSDYGPGLQNLKPQFVHIYTTTKAVSQCGFEPPEKYHDTSVWN